AVLLGRHKWTPYDNTARWRQTDSGRRQDAHHGACTAFRPAESVYRLLSGAAKSADRAGGDHPAGDAAGKTRTPPAVPHDHGPGLSRGRASAVGTVERRHAQNQATRNRASSWLSPGNRG